MISTKLADRLMKQSSERRLIVETFTPISEMPSGELWDTIKTLYKSKRQLDRFLATLLNGLATEKKARFFLSKRLYSRMLNADPNVSRGDVNNDEFEPFMKIQQDAKVFRCLQPPSPFVNNPSGIGNMAGIYEIVDEEILSHLGPPQSSISSPTPSPSRSPESSHEYEDKDKDETESENEVGSEGTQLEDCRTRPSEGGSSVPQDSKNEIQKLESDLYLLEMTLRLGDNSVKDKVMNLRETIAKRKQTGNLSIN